MRLCGDLYFSMVRQFVFQSIFLQVSYILKKKVFLKVIYECLWLHSDATLVLQTNQQNQYQQNPKTSLSSTCYMHKCVCGSTCQCVTCSFSNECSTKVHSSILFLSAIIKTALPNMDREAKEEYLVVIQAKDMGGHSGGLSGTTTLTVTLTDVNDNPPKFAQSKWFPTRDRNHVHFNCNFSQLCRPR